MLNKIHTELGIPISYSEDCGIPTYTEPFELVSIGLDIFGRPQKLTREAAEKWSSMQLAAGENDVSLYVVSAFRSVDYQTTLIKKKLQKGQSIEEILRTNAAPGHSEHHSGRALDLTTLNCKPLSEEFEDTDAFHWLSENANKYNFYMSFPIQNEWSIDYEPWHWCYSRT